MTTNSTTKADISTVLKIHTDLRQIRKAQDMMENGI